MPRAAVAICLLLAVVAGGCSSSDPKSEAPSAADVEKQLAGAPPELAALHEQANDLLGGGVDAFRARLKKLRGHPVVVNKWASWCGPCRAEFPHFQKQAVEHGRRIAFLGVDSNDNDGDAKKFLEKFPVTFPSYEDGHLAIAQEMKVVNAFPSTVFYDSKGKLAYIHQGQYLSESKLAADIDRFAR